MLFSTHTIYPRGYRRPRGARLSLRHAEMDNGPVIKLCFRTVWGMLRVQKAGRLEIQIRKVPSCNKRLLIVASCESRPGQGLMLLELEITNTRGKKPRRNATKMTFQKKERYDVPVASASRYLGCYCTRPRVPDSWLSSFDRILLWDGQRRFQSVWD